MSSVEVVPYNPEWKKWFNELREPIWALIHEYAVDVVHVGSTSIEGMSAKPIIDIDILVDDSLNFEKIKEKLERLGYKHVGDLGISGREAFKEDPSSKYPHNLYLCHIDSVAYRNHRLLKKHLTENPEDFRRYNDLKLNLAKSAQNREEYWRSKTMLILEFLEAEGVPSEEIDRIRAENLG
jgi:GrpB-like predicted nucleotidyltransferase (UPF0157 family)